MDDILKSTFETELGDKDLQPILNQFCVSSNEILIEIKKFKDWVSGFQQQKKSDRL